MEDKYGYIDWEQTNEGTSADLSSLKSYEIEALYEHRKDYAKAQKNRFTTND